jgi:hypothetical protein
MEYRVSGVDGFEVVSSVLFGAIEYFSIFVSFGGAASGVAGSVAN